MLKPLRTILVIGGGLGGLAFAQILRHSTASDKFKVVIYERDASATHREQGYQIGINQSGFSFLSSIPHIATVLDTPQKANAARFLDADLNVMLELKHGPGADSMAGLVNRWKLRKALSEGLDVKWGKKFTGYEETDSQVIAHFEDGTEASGDLLIGADGAKSRVRAQRSPDLRLEDIPVLTTAGSIALTPAIKAKLPKLVKLVENTYILRVLAPEGNSVLVMSYDAPDGDTRLLWAFSFPSASAPRLPSDPTELKRTIASRSTKIFGTELALLICETSAEGYIFDAPRFLASVVPTKHNPLGKTSRVTLLGDAAHAMTTHRGIGANTAFADAADLAHALIMQTQQQAGDDDPWLGSLAQYEEVMIRRGFEAVKMSKQVTEMLHMAGVKSVIRNAMLRAVGWLLWGKYAVWG